MNKQQLLAIVVVLALGAGLTTWALKKIKPAVVADAHGGGDEPGEQVKKGPHGGRLLREGDFATEVTIFERGVPPQFRVYGYEKDKPVDPAQLKLTIELSRLGGRTDVIQFKPEGDYLVGDQTVYEPHSFAVKVTAEHGGRTHRWQYESPEARVELSAAEAKNSGVMVGVAGPAKVKTQLELSGEVRLNADRMAHVAARFEGVVTEVRKAQGDLVKRGEVLAIIESRELAQAKNEFIEGVYRLDLAQAVFVREERLWQKKISPEQDYLVARQAREEAEIRRQAARQKLLALGLTAAELKELAVEPDGTRASAVRKPFPDGALTRYELKAPLDGTVIARSVATGEIVRADSELFTIADLGSVWVEAIIYAQHLRQVRVNQSATIRSVDLAAEAQGSVTYLGAVLNEQTRSTTARVVLPNPEGVWRPGLFVKVQVVQDETTVPVAVKASAVQTFRDWTVVFVNEGNFYEPLVVETGRRDGEWVEIVSGLKPGLRYVTDNSFIIKADILKSGASHDH